MPTVSLRAFGQSLPEVNDPFIKNADPMLSSIEIRVLVKSPIGLFVPDHERRAISVAAFRKNYTLSTKTSYVFDLVCGPPSGWEWVFINYRIVARRTK